MKKHLINGILCAAIIGMAISVLALLWYKSRDYRAMRYWEKIAELKETAGDRSGQEILPQYRSLFDENPDIVGWLSIEGAHIDHPVMQTKEDPEYYLRRDFDREEDNSGTPFADYRCDVTPYQSMNILIYGHNSTFRYLFDYAYPNSHLFAENSTIRFDTLSEEGEYKVVAVFYAESEGAYLLEPWDPEDPEAYEWYNYIEVDSLEGFRRYADGIMARSLYDTGETLEPSDHLLTLICCARDRDAGHQNISSFANARLVIVAKKIRRSSFNA